MKFALVSTTGYLLLVNLENKTVTPLENERCEYYGISWFAKSDDLVLSHSGVNNSNLIDIASYAQSEVGWISSGSCNSKKFLSQPHQIFCASDGRVICANTGRNAITAIDLNKPGVYQESGVSESRWDRLSLDTITGDHLNSVFLQGDRLFVIAHRFNKGSLLGTFSYPEMALLDLESIGARTGMHNIWITAEGQRISCQSEAGSLVDIDSNAPLWEAGAPIYTRGLAAGKSYVVVGESQRTGRDLRHSSISGLWILDRRTWQAVDHICLGPYGAVNEVRLLDVPDEAHHNTPFSGLDRLLSQESMLSRIAKERLVAAKTAYDHRYIWSNYELVFGAPETLSNGAKRAVSDSLCLVVKHAGNTPLSFDFSLETRPPGAHVSAVLGYKGMGADTEMVAFLVQAHGMSSTYLSVWRHDGKSWTLLPDFDVYDLPMAGNLSLLSTDVDAVVMFNKNEILRVNALKLGLENYSGAVGIRWINAIIKPANIS